MNFGEFIDKTISKNRGYKYHTYQTEIWGDTFELYHCGTKILSVNLKKKEVLNADSKRYSYEYDKLRFKKAR